MCVCVCVCVMDKVSVHKFTIFTLRRIVCVCMWFSIYIFLCVTCMFMGVNIICVYQFVSVIG